MDFNNDTHIWYMHALLDSNRNINTLLYEPDYIVFRFLDLMAVDITEMDYGKPHQSLAQYLPK